MIHVTVHPTEFANAVANAYEIGKEPAQSAVFPMTAVIVTGTHIYAYGRSRHTACVASVEVDSGATGAAVTVIELDEANALQSACRKVKGGQAARIGVAVYDNRLIVSDGDTQICDLESIELDLGELEGIDSDVEAALAPHDPMSPVESLTLTTDIFKRFTKVRSSSPVMDFDRPLGGLTMRVRMGTQFVGLVEAVNAGAMEDPGFNLWDVPAVAEVSTGEAQAPSGAPEDEPQDWADQMFAEYEAP